MTDERLGSTSGSPLSSRASRLRVDFGGHSASKGALRVRSSWNTHPRLHTSAANADPSVSAPGDGEHTSGAAYLGVPTRRRASVAAEGLSASEASVARPKSANLSVSSTKRRFAGLTSPCATPRLCACASALARGLSVAHASASSIRAPSRLRRSSAALASPRSASSKTTAKSRSPRKHSRAEMTHGCAPSRARTRASHATRRIGDAGGRRRAELFLFVGEARAEDPSPSADDERISRGGRRRDPGTSRGIDFTATRRPSRTRVPSRTTANPPFPMMRPTR